MPFLRESEYILTFPLSIISSQAWITVLTSEQIENQNEIATSKTGAHCKIITELESLGTWCYYLLLIIYCRYCVYYEYHVYPADKTCNSVI